MSKPIILTGIRSNSEPTLGNYLGAILPMVDMAKKHAGEYQVNMFVPDLHSFTTPIDFKKLYENTMRNVQLFVACGLPIDHDDVFVYRQSYIPAHSELAWILGCFTGFGEASRMIEFKDKSQQLGDDRVSVALFNYPVLMAADILLYGAEWVPVGEDQRQHLELTRDLALRLNNKFGDLFVVPHELSKQQSFVNRDQAPRIRSLRNPERKMSKSVNDPAGTILLSDKPEDAAQKVLGATTDSLGSIHFDWAKQPGITNLLQIYSLISGKEQSAVNAEWDGKSQYGEFKSVVAESVKSFLASTQHALATVDEKALAAKLQASEKAMNDVANLRLQRVQAAVGLRPSK